LVTYTIYLAYILDLELAWEKINMKNFFERPPAYVSTLLSPVSENRSGGRVVAVYVLLAASNILSSFLRVLFITFLITIYHYLQAVKSHAFLKQL
jgi:hypothetical protein